MSSNCFAKNKGNHKTVAATKEVSVDKLAAVAALRKTAGRQRFFKLNWHRNFLCDDLSFNKIIVEEKDVV